MLTTGDSGFTQAHRHTTHQLGCQRSIRTGGFAVFVVALMMLAGCAAGTAESSTGTTREQNARASVVPPEPTALATEEVVEDLVEESELDVMEPSNAEAAPTVPGSATYRETTADGQMTREHTFATTCSLVPGQVMFASGMDLEARVDGTTTGYLFPDEGASEWLYVIDSSAVAGHRQWHEGEPVDQRPYLTLGVSWPGDDGASQGAIFGWDYIEVATVDVNDDLRSGTIVWDDGPNTGGHAVNTITWSCP